MFHNSMRAECEKLGISKSYHPVLFNLSRCDGLLQHDLVRLTGLKAPTVSVTLQKMETEGLITRGSDENDERCMRICITEKGRLTENKIKNAAAGVESAMTGCLDEEQTEMLRELLRLLSDGQPRQ